jgi:PKD repeat protein
MAIRKTETRIPDGSAASDLGEAFVAADGRCALVSFITSPLVVNRENTYIVFVTDAGLAAQTQSFAWSFSENGGTAATQTTQIPEAAYSPQGTGSLNVTVTLMDAANAVQATLSLTQAMVPLHPGLEALISAATDQTGPTISDPDVSRELVNDYNLYYQAVALPTPEAGDSFQQFVFSFVYEGASRKSPADRKQLIENLAQALDSSATDDFVNRTAEGVGVCNVRLPLLAMMPSSGSPLLTWTELPQPASQNEFADQDRRQKFAALDQTKLIDYFNLARFPKSNINQCAHIVAALRDHYFPGVNFNDVLTRMSGAPAFWIAMHFRQGPLITS